MSNYNKVNDFAAKDAINAPVVGAEFQQEFDAIQTAVNSKANSEDALLTGVPTAPTPEGDTTNQIVNVQYVTEYTYDKENTVSSNLAFPAPQSQINALQTNIIKDTVNQKSSIKLLSGTAISFFTNNIERVSVNSSGLTASALTSQGTTTISNGQLVLQGTGRIQGVDTVSSARDAANKEYVDAVDAKVNNTRIAGAVGSCGFFQYRKNTNTPVNFGATVSGSDLIPASTREAGGSTGQVSGTWRCMGYARNFEDSNDVWRYTSTLFVRIS